jgi:hypothetical protein
MDASQFAEVQSTILERQNMNDSEIEDAETLRDELLNYFIKAGFNPDSDKIFISSKLMNRVSQQAFGEIWAPVSKNKLKTLLETSPFANLSPTRRAETRGYYWTGNNYTTGSIKICPESNSTI